MATLRRQLALRGRITRHVPKEHNLQHETRMNATFSDVRRKSAASCTYVGRAIVLDGCRHVVESRRDDCRLRHVLADRDPRPVAVVADVGVVDVRRVSVARVDGGVENLNRRAVCNSPILFFFFCETERARQIEEVSLRYFTDVDLVGEVQEEAGADGADDGVVEAIRDGVVHIRRNLAV